MKLTFIEAPKRFEGTKSKIHIYKDEAGNKYIYKELTPPSEKAVKNELTAHKLAKLAGVNVLSFIEYKEIPNRKPGLLMNYLETAITLVDFNGQLSSTQKQDLRKMILFDMWVGNSDRHTANVLVTDKLIAFDHAQLFNQTEQMSRFIKRDIGRRLDKEYTDKLEKLMRLRMSTREALAWFEFKENDFESVENMNEKEISNIVNEAELAYLVKRKQLADFPFT